VGSHLPLGEFCIGNVARPPDRGGKMSSEPSTTLFEPSRPSDVPSAIGEHWGELGALSQPSATKAHGAKCWQDLRVAIVHHWFISRGGGERVVETIASLFPSADLFTLFLDKEKLPPALQKHKITTSFIDRSGVTRKAHRHFLPLYPLAVEMLDLSGYDLIITSDSGPMKGVLTDPHSTHICYCHSPMRYIWDGYSAYLRGMPRLTRLLFGVAAHYVRNWEYAAAQRVDHFIANSNYVAERIHKYYRRDSTVIHPPINTSQSFLARKHEDYYLAVGRLVPYKRTDILIEACSKLGRRLVIVGDGPEMERLKKRSEKNVEFLGEVDDCQLRNLYAQCRALLFAADEDFGMVPLEAQSYGRPVIAFGKGGSLETVIGAYPPIRAQKLCENPPITGVFFGKQTAISLTEAIRSFESCEEVFLPHHIRLHARKFDTSIFVSRLRNYIDGVMKTPFKSPRLKDKDEISQSGQIEIPEAIDGR
jgi:glycosyltransferase involved in cell wall biosynthesis